jgi:hypothetical protein
VTGAEMDRHKAAQAKADEVIRAIAELPGAGPLLRVAVTDAITGQRLATGFVAYQVDGVPHLRLVAS